jgi:hypothetical protein
VQGRRFCCGLTQKPVSLKHDKVKRRARVAGVWKITYNQFDGEAIEDLLPELNPDSAAAKIKRCENSAAAKARRLAKKHDIEIEVEWGFGRYTRILVWGCALTMDSAVIDDPYAGDHYAEDWQDALERVETYVELLEEFKRNEVG